MAKARITLNDQGPLSYHGNGYDLERGQSFITTKAEDILFFSNRAGWTVEVMEGSSPKAAPVGDDEDAPKPKTAKPKKAPPPPVEDDADDEESVGDTDEEDGEEEADDEDDEEVTGELDATELKKQTRASLATLAEERGLKVDSSMNKTQLIELLTK